MSSGLLLPVFPSGFGLFSLGLASLVFFAAAAVIAAVFLAALRVDRLLRQVVAPRMSDPQDNDADIRADPNHSTVSPSPRATLTRDDVQMLVKELEAEVNNGGFDQFFFNEAGNRAVETIEALEAIGAQKAADIVRRACARFPGGMPPASWFIRQEVLDAVSPDSEAFEQEDQDFYAYEEDLASRLAVYAKRS